MAPLQRGKKRRPGAKDLPSALRCSDALFVNFLDGCLQWDSRERFNPDDALAHEWITVKPAVTPAFESGDPSFDSFDPRFDSFDPSFDPRLTAPPWFLKLSQPNEQRKHAFQLGTCFFLFFFIALRPPLRRGECSSAAVAPRVRPQLVRAARQGRVCNFDPPDLQGTPQVFSKKSIVKKRDDITALAFNL